MKTNQGGKGMGKRQEAALETRQKIVDATPLASPDGSVIYLEGGRQYVVRESDVPQGYANVTGDVVVDLSGYTSPMQAYEVITVTLENRPTGSHNVCLHRPKFQNLRSPKRKNHHQHFIVSHQHY